MRHPCPWLSSTFLALCTAGALAACGGGSNGPPDGPTGESCNATGDEDGNGLADCADPACAELVQCQSRCGNAKVETGEQCDDGNSIDGDPCTNACTENVSAYLKASNAGGGDAFASQVALSSDGRTVVVSAPGEASASTGVDGNSSDNTAPGAGAVYVFTWLGFGQGQGWRQQAYLKASNTGPDDGFGRQLAISGDGSLLAVGAPDEDSASSGTPADDSASNAGAVYVFARSGGTWTQQAYVKASNIGADDSFGEALALSRDGSTLAVGAPGEDSGATDVGGNQANETAGNAGAVYVLTRSGGTWTQQAYVKASNTGAADGFGTSVALTADGSVLAVGAPGEDSAATGVNGNQSSEAGPDSGAVYVLTRTGTTWKHAAYVKASNSGPNDGFGSGVALDGTGALLAVGAPCEASAATGIGGDQASDAADCSGAAYVFARTGTAWAQDAYVKASNTEADDNFGAHVALSDRGGTLLVSAPREASAAIGVGGDQSSDAAEGAGAAYRFRREAAGWQQKQYIKATNTGLGDGFGVSLAISLDGTTLAVGAPGEASSATTSNGNQNDNSATGAGAAYLYP
jgi:cysteine-rich repeat protein